MEIETLNLKEAAALLKMTSSSLRKKAKSGILPGAKPGRDWIFIKSDLIQYIRMSYNSTVRQPLLNFEREAQWQQKKSSTNVVKSGGIASPTNNLASKFAEVHTKLKEAKRSKY